MAGQPFTTDDLDRMPDDGRRYELLDGVLVVSPRPGTIHQIVATELVVDDQRFGVTRPFPVEVVPARLVEGLSG